MLHNLQAELKRKGIKHEDVAAKINVSPRTFSNKINGATAFSFAETVKIRDSYFPGLELEYLFANEGGEEGEKKNERIIRTVQG